MPLESFSEMVSDILKLRISFVLNVGPTIPGNKFKYITNIVKKGKIGATIEPAIQCSGYFKNYFLFLWYCELFQDLSLSDFGI